MKSTPDVVDLAAVAAGVEVRAAVDGEVIGVGAVAVDGLVGDAEAGGRSHLVEAGHRDSRHQGDQFDVIAAVQRQVLNLLGVDGVGESRRKRY